jgi:DNA polymerase (family 10)
MNKKEIAEVLNEIGTLLELKGENPFKVRAYQNGARALETLTEKLEDVQKKLLSCSKAENWNFTRT